MQAITLTGPEPDPVKDLILWENWRDKEFDARSRVVINQTAKLRGLEAEVRHLQEELAKLLSLVGTLSPAPEGKDQIEETCVKCDHPVDLRLTDAKSGTTRCTKCGDIILQRKPDVEEKPS